MAKTKKVVISRERVSEVGERVGFINGNNEIVIGIITEVNLERDCTKDFVRIGNRTGVNGSIVVNRMSLYPVVVR